MLIARAATLQKTCDICKSYFLCELKSPGGSSIQGTLLNSYDKVNPTSLFGYGVQRKMKQLNNWFYLRKRDIKPTFSRFDFSNQ